MPTHHNPDDGIPGDDAPPRPQDAVGYKKPPFHSRFKSGRSGNAKGRPRGRPNVATIAKAIFNQPIPVRTGDKTRRMPAVEAIVRSLTAKAGQADEKALFALMQIVEMTGRTNDINDDERRKRAMHLPSSFSPEEHDLLLAEAREKERQAYRAKAEADPARYATSADGTPSALIIPPAVQAGDELAAACKFDNALLAYRREVARCKAQLVANDGDKQALDDFRRVVGRIGLIADKLLLAGAFSRALGFADEALAEGATPFWIAPANPIGVVSENTTWIAAIRAHARMFLGHEEEARSFYVSFQGNKRLVMTSWENAILQDFAKLRAAGFSHQLMDEIEKRYTDEGWTIRPGNKMTERAEASGEEAVFIKMHPDDIKSGDLLEKYGKTEQAAGVYLRNLQRALQKLKSVGNSPAAEANVQIAVGRIARTAEKFLCAGHFAQALESADEAIAASPDKLELRAIRANALMFLHRDSEARAIFGEHRGQTVGDQSWEAVILEGFARYHKAGHSHALTDAIQKEFGGAGETFHRTVNTRTPDNGGGIPLAALIQASDIHSGGRLEQLGRLDDALTVYGRALEACTARIAKIAQGQINMQVIDDRSAVVKKLGDLSAMFLIDGEFAKALAAADCALSALPNLPLLNIYRAHALMFLDRADEARTLYLQCRKQKVDAERSGEAVIIQDFASLRAANLLHPVIEEVERLFSAGDPDDQVSASSPSSKGPARDDRENAAEGPSQAVDHSRYRSPSSSMLPGSGRGPRTT